MLDISAQLGTFDSPDLSPDDMANLIVNWVNALVATNLMYLRIYPNTVPLYRSGVYYREEQFGQEDFFDIPTVLLQGYADCEDLAAWRCAEYLSVGEPSNIVVSWEAIQHNSGDIDILFHVRVESRYGLEDPSEILGMGSMWGNRLTG
jgi:hypothetical protein